MPNHLHPHDLEAYLNGHLTPTERRRMQHHLAACPACEEALRAEDHLRRGLRQLQMPLPTLSLQVGALLAESKQARYEMNWKGLLLAMVISLLLLLPFLPSVNDSPFSTQPQLVNEPIATATQPIRFERSLAPTQNPPSVAQSLLNLTSASPVPIPMATAQASLETASLR